MKKEETFFKEENKRKTKEKKKEKKRKNMERTYVNENEKKKKKNKRKTKGPMAYPSEKAQKIDFLHESYESFSRKS